MIDFNIDQLIEQQTKALQERFEEFAEASSKLDDPALKKRLQSYENRLKKCLANQDGDEARKIMDEITFFSKTL